MATKKIKELTIQECRKICKKYDYCCDCPLSLLDREKYSYCSVSRMFHLSKYALNKKVEVEDEKNKIISD